MYKVISVFVLALCLFMPSEKLIASQIDLLFVLDKSGSVKTHETEFLTRNAVSNLIEDVSKDTSTRRTINTSSVYEIGK